MVFVSFENIKINTAYWYFLRTGVDRHHKIIMDSWSSSHFIFFEFLTPLTAIIVALLFHYAAFLCLLALVILLYSLWRLITTPIEQALCEDGRKKRNICWLNDKIVVWLGVLERMHQFEHLIIIINKSIALVDGILRILFTIHSVT